MVLAHSRITAQGQVSVPAKVRRQLAVGPGSVLEWDAGDGHVVIRRAGRRSSADIHDAVFGKRPAPRTLKQLKAGVGAHLKKKHARD